MHSGTTSQARNATLLAEKGALYLQMCEKCGGMCLPPGSYAHALTLSKRFIPCPCSNGQNLKKIENVQFPKVSALLIKNQFYEIIAFKILKMEYKFEYTR